MAKDKVIKGAPGSYLVDLSKKVLGKFDDKGEFKTSDPDTMRRIELLEQHQAALEKESLGERLARENHEEQYSEYRKIAEIMVDVMIKKGSK